MPRKSVSPVRGKHGVRGRARVDCIGRMVMRPSDREIASQSRTQYNVRGRRWIDCNGCMVRQPSGREIESQFAVLFAATKELITPAEPTKKRRGDTIEFAWIGTHK